MSDRRTFKVATPGTDWSSSVRVTAPLTVREAVAAARLAYEGGTLRSYNTHWRHLDEKWADRPLKDISTAELAALRDSVIQNAQSGGGHGLGAGEHFTTAARALYRLHRQQVGSYNPAEDLPPLRRPDTDRRGLHHNEVGRLLEAALGMPDPDLALLLCVFVLQSGARLGGALGLTLSDVVDCAPFVTLREKEDSVRKVPISDALREALVLFGVSRGASLPNDRIFRGRRKAPLDDSRVSKIFKRIHETVPELEGVSLHWLRHTAINNYSRISGDPVVTALFAGHDFEREFSTTGNYLRREPESLITFCHVMNGETKQRGRLWAQPLLPDGYGGRR